MSLRVRRVPSVKYKLLTAAVAAFALIAQPMYGAIAGYVAYAVPVITGTNNISEISTYSELKEAFENEDYKYIKLARNVVIEAPTSLLIARDGVRFDGNDSTIKLADDGAGWHGAYALKVWKANDVKINSLKTTGGDAGVLVSSSQVTFTGNTHNNNHEFGGIEVSRSTTPGLPNSTVVMEGALWNAASSEVNGTPAVWVINGEGTFNHDSLYQPLYKATHIKDDQTQYYLKQSNSGTVATNVTTAKTYTSLQAAVDAAVAEDEIRLETDVTLTQAVKVNEEVTIDGNGKTLTTNWTDVYNGNNGALVITHDDVTVKNLKVTGQKLSFLHGINVSGAENVTLRNNTIKNSAAGVNIGYSTVKVDTLTTSGNTWYGVGIDKNSAVEITGTSNHDEAEHVTNDNITNTTLADTNNQYVAVSQVGNKRIYKLGTIAAPVLNNPNITVNSSQSHGVATWSHSGEYVKHYEYREYNNLAAATADTTGTSGSYWTQTPTAKSQNVGVSWTGNKTLYYRVVAIGIDNRRSAPSEIGTVVIDKVAPATPVITHPSGWHMSVTEVKWSTTDTSDVKFDVYTGSHPSNVNTLLESDLTSTTFEYNFTTGPHFVRVVAKDAAGNSTSTGVRGFNVIGEPSIITPEVNQILNKSDGSSFTTNWTPVNGVGGVDYYEVEYSIDRNNDDDFNDTGEKAIRKVTGATSYDQNFSSNFQGDMSVRVRAVYNIAYAGSKNGPWSNAVNYSRDVEAPAAPADIEITKDEIKGIADAGSTIKILREGVEPATVATDSDGNWQYSFNPALTPGTYDFTIFAVDDAGNESTKEERTFVVTPPAVEGETEVPGGSTGEPAVDTDNNKPVETLEPIENFDSFRRPTVGSSTVAFFGGSSSTSSTSEGDDQNDTAILGAQTSKQPAAATPALEATEDGWKIFGLAWYWWLLILAAVAAIWWAIAGYRRRQDEA